jgi:hypothetical protein
MDMHEVNSYMTKETIVKTKHTGWEKIFAAEMPFTGISAAISSLLP